MAKNICRNDASPTRLHCNSNTAGTNQDILWLNPFLQQPSWYKKWPPVYNLRDHILHDTASQQQPQNGWTVHIQDPNTKRFKRTLIYFNTDTQYANNLPSTEQAVKTKPKQGKSFALIFHPFWPFICCLSVVLWLDKGDFPKNVDTVHPCQNK